jgi:hypothetical protein
MSNDVNASVSESDPVEPIDWAEMLTNVVSIYTVLYPIVASGSWEEWEASEQLELANVIRTGRKVFENILRPPFDKTTIAGHKTGKVSTEVKPLRAERDPDGAKPGRPSPTAMDVLTKALAK